MSNLIPKSLASQKHILYKFITWIDILFVIVFLGIAVAMAFAFNASVIVRIIVAVIVFLALMCLLIPINKNNERVYQFIVYWLRYLFSNRKYSNVGAIQTKQLIPYHEFEEDTLAIKKTTHSAKSYVRAIKISGNDLTSLDYQEQTFIFNSLQQILKNINTPFSLIKFDEPLILQEQAKYLLSEIKGLDEVYANQEIGEDLYLACKFQLYNQLDNLYHPDKILEGISEQKSFYLFIYHKNQVKLNELIESTHNKLRNINLENEILDRYDLTNAIKNIFNPLNDPITNEKIDELENNVEEIFNFKNFNIKFNRIEVNKKLCFNISTVCDYPLTVDDYWLALIMINTPATMIWNVSNMSLSMSKSLINKAIVNAQSSVMNTNKNVQKREMQLLANNFEQLADQIACDNDQLRNTCMYFISYGLDKKSLANEIKKLHELLDDKNIKIDHLNCRQLEAFKACLPSLNINNDPKFIREIPLSTIAHGYPFMNHSLLDKNGLLLGYNITKDSIVFNQFDLSSDSNRKNYNMLLLGTSGSGKSFSVKKILNWHIMNNRKVIIIDPEREYKDLCHYYSGCWLDASNGNKTRINPLQILNSIDEVVENAQLNYLQIMQNHLQFLEQFFGVLYRDLTSNQIRILITLIKEVYLDFNLHQTDINYLSNEQFPIIQDVINKITNLSNEYIEKMQINYQDLMSIWNLLNSDFSNDGKYQTLYNGYSTVRFDNNLITFDVNELFEKGNFNLTQGQLFLILAWISNIVKLNHNEQEIIIAIDEAHLLIDKDNPVALNFMFQMVKRIRKRNGGIILITQNPDDFLANEEIVKKTTAMINNTQYMLILNLSSKNIKDVEQMFKSYGTGLSENEKNYIARAKRGQGLFMVSGFNRHMIQIKHTSREVDAYLNQVHDENKRLVMGELERREALKKMIEKMHKSLASDFVHFKTIASYTKKSKPKKGEVERMIKEDNDRFINSLSN